MDRLEVVRVTRTGVTLRGLHEATITWDHLRWVAKEVPKYAPSYNDALRRAVEMAAEGAIYVGVGLIELDSRKALFRAWWADAAVSSPAGLLLPEPTTRARYLDDRGAVFATAGDAEDYAELMAAAAEAAGRTVERIGGFWLHMDGRRAD